MPGVLLTLSYAHFEWTSRKSLRKNFFGLWPGPPALRDCYVVGVELLDHSSADCESEEHYHCISLAPDTAVGWSSRQCILFGKGTLTNVSLLTLRLQEEDGSLIWRILHSR
jgi:hypothetical protein